MGPDKDPREIHLFRDRIQQIVKQQLGGQNDQKAVEEAVERALIEVITHEVGHIGRHRTQDQILTQPFFDESAAERQSQEFMGRLSCRDLVLSKRAVPLGDFFPQELKENWVQSLKIGVQSEAELLERIRLLSGWGKVEFTTHSFDRLVGRKESRDRVAHEIRHSLKNAEMVRTTHTGNVEVLGPDTDGDLVGSIIRFDTKKGVIVVITTNLRPKVWKYDNVQEADDEKVHIMDIFPIDRVGDDWEVKVVNDGLATFKRKDGVSFTVATYGYERDGVTGRLSWPKKWGQKFSEAKMFLNKWSIDFNFNAKDIGNSLQFIEAMIPKHEPSFPMFNLTHREQNTMDHEEQVLPFLEKVPKLQSVIAPTPSDKPIHSTLPGYEHFHGEIGNNPQGLFSIPLGIGGGGR